MFIIQQIFALMRDWSKHVTWPNIPQLKLGSITHIFPHFQNRTIEINTIAHIWHKNLLGYLSSDIICSWMLPEVCSQKTICFSEKIVSMDKYLSIFPWQLNWGYCLYVFHLLWIEINIVCCVIICSVELNTFVTFVIGLQINNLFKWFEPRS